ncbi:hypothetical protein MRB53_006667 [Persea americana]|uniref:Uncharacterized protein n=1 Tax=Persea americana TaxID=3435 RepID=A0ACC2MGU4_PERAE|nr:hypothetical protein MRB53_006667 [Persea americana]
MVVGETNRINIRFPPPVSHLNKKGYSFQSNIPPTAKIPEDLLEWPYSIVEQASTSCKSGEQCSVRNLDGQTQSQRCPKPQAAMLTKVYPQGYSTTRTPTSHQRCDVDWMLTKGVKWAGIKNTEHGEEAIRAGLDPTNESDAFEHTFKTMSRPLWLLQVTYFIDHMERSCDQVYLLIEREAEELHHCLWNYIRSAVTPKKVYVKRPAPKSLVKKKKRGKMGPTKANPTKLFIPIDEESQDKPRGPVHLESPVKPSYQSDEASMHGYVEALNIPFDDDPNLVPL